MKIDLYDYINPIATRTNIYAELQELGRRLNDLSYHARSYSDATYRENADNILIKTQDFIERLVTYAEAVRDEESDQRNGVK